MFVARADAFGLAQLYQLRGRIGRSKERAYCYLLVPEPEHITDEARRRLEALQRFTELGAGFQIASQDLEIRGGGELLGAKQSGSIAAVGFDQYVKMLDAAVAELGGKPIHSRDRSRAVDRDARASSPTTTSPIRASASSSTSGCRRSRPTTSSRDVMAEIADRYGPLPGDVILLGELMGVKAIARGAGALALEITRARVAIALPDGTARSAAALVAGGWRQLPDGRFAIAPPRARAARRARDGPCWTPLARAT